MKRIALIDRHLEVSLELIKSCYLWERGEKKAWVQSVNSKGNIESIFSHHHCQQPNHVITIAYLYLYVNVCWQWEKYEITAALPLKVMIIQTNLVNIPVLFIHLFPPFCCLSFTAAVQGQPRLRNKPIHPLHRQAKMALDVDTVCNRSSPLVSPTRRHRASSVTESVLRPRRR